MLTAMNYIPSSPLIRSVAKWFLVALVIGVVVYRVKLRPVPVEAFKVVPAPITAQVMGTGTLEARVKTTISARIQERLAEVLVDQNDPVHTGQLLAQLDEGELKQQVEIAGAALAAARATIDRIKADEARAEAVLKQARLDHERVSELLATQVSAQADFDKTMEQLRVAEADLKRSQAANQETELQKITAEKNLQYHQERLSYARIISPYNGLVVRRDRDPGGVVVPGGSILQIISTNEIWVSAWVDETAIAQLAPGQSAQVIFRSEPTCTYPGEVARLGRETDRETREILVDVHVSKLPRNWTVGQRAEVFVATRQKPSALVVSSPFVQWRQGKPGLFVNDRGKARWRNVQLGLRGREAIEITQGVSAGEMVVKPVSDQKQQLNEGQRIRVL